jgi:hypothetical protein
LTALLPFVAIVVMGVLGIAFHRRAPIGMRRLVIGLCATAMIYFAVVEPEQRWFSLLLAFLGFMFVIRMRGPKQVG